MGSVTVRWIDAEGTLQQGGLEEFEPAQRAAWCWVDVAGPAEETLARVGAPFGLHPLAVEDSLHPQRRPKLDLYPEGPFLTWLTAHSGEDGRLRIDELDVFCGPTYLVTLHDGVVEAIDEVARDAQRLMSKGPDWVLHGILDRLVDSMLPVADGIGDRLEDVEDRMLANPTPADLEELYSLRRQLLVLHRIVSPQRDMVRALTRERDHVSEEAYRYFDDVVDHLVHIEESLETYRDIGSAVMDIYLSAQSNRLNEVMKVLTVVTVLIGALTLLSGIYGMNLLGGMWPPPMEPWAFPAAMGAMLVLAGMMAVYFRRKNWW
ncbi:MAG: magnesium/cobalt transporter CorA [Coriobacteriia bacterium]|nr:magnesium/cobalt transporter CorA [Coriobacteriia bacterium]